MLNYRLKSTNTYPQWGIITHSTQCTRLWKKRKLHKVKITAKQY